MKILEQILQEIVADYEIPFLKTEAEGRAYMQGKTVQANEDRRIIRSYMEDDGDSGVKQMDKYRTLQ